MASDFWSDPVNRDVADYLGRAVIDSIRFRAAANAAEAENEFLRAEVTRERGELQRVEGENASLRTQIDDSARRAPGRRTRAK